LLKGSRTNATVQITVEMNFVGGDRDWVAYVLSLSLLGRFRYWDLELMIDHHLSRDIMWLLG
jgi:hypothetical protein